MDPVALEKAFELYPDVKLVVCAELYGFPGRVVLIKEICEHHGALLIEDAAEAMGATLHGKQCGSFGELFGRSAITETRSLPGLGRRLSIDKRYRGCK